MDDQMGGCSSMENALGEDLVSKEPHKQAAKAGNPAAAVRKIYQVA